ncbi:MAG: endo alpha-1,4 polygalactosaminidase [Candidatus Auribacterota bacterium]
MREVLVIITISLCLFLFVSSLKSGEKSRLYPWLCYYGKITSVDDLKGYAMAILDADSVPDPTAYKNAGITCIGYVSLGEVEDYRWYWKKIRNEAYILDENPDWKGNYYIDPRDKRWSDFFIRRVIPKILNKGYDGIFLDTIDTALYLEWRDPEKYAGAKLAMAKIIREIRKAYPEIIIISNNGIAMLETFAGSVDIALVEDLYTGFDFENERYTDQDADTTIEWTKKLKQSQKKYGIQVITLDYAEASDRQKIKTIYKTSLENGFWPLVSDIKLATIPDPSQQGDL